MGMNESEGDGMKVNEIECGWKWSRIRAEFKPNLSYIWAIFERNSGEFQGKFEECGILVIFERLNKLEK